MTWLLILFPAMVLACCLAIAWASELAHRKIRRQRRSVR